MRPVRLVAVVVGVLSAWTFTGCRAQGYQQLSCRGGGYQSLLALEAQAVDTARFIPCVAALAAGWSYGGSEIASDQARFWLDSDRAGAHAAEVTLSPDCGVHGQEVDEGEIDRYAYRATADPLAPIHRFEDRTDAFPTATSYRFSGGCVTVRLSATASASPVLATEALHGVGFLERAEWVAAIEDDVGLTLCGVGAPPCTGDERSTETHGSP